MRAGQSLSALEIRIQGQPLSGGGVGMTSSVVTLGSASDPTQYRGVITSLNGGNIDAYVQSIHGALAVQAQLNIDTTAGAITGTTSVASVPLRAHPETAQGDGDGGR
jgi:hypothetical protein